mgnify:CR=1 FL=1
MINNIRTWFFKIRSRIYKKSNIKTVIHLKGKSEIVPVNSLPNDGKVIDDTRNFGE